MPEPLDEVLKRTGYRASLDPAYLQGHAPAVLHKDGHTTPERPSYYGLPAIKKPEWLWYIPAYFFVGGLSSGAYIVATLADILGRPEDRPLVRAGRYLALAGMLLSPLLLIADLGRPERFLYMLRVFKPRSLMNLGSWVLTLFGLFTGLAAVAQALQDLSVRMSALKPIAALLRVCSWLGILPAMFIGSYTGLLISATNVPLWAGNRVLMGPLFFASSMSTGMAATRLVGRLFGRVAPESEARLVRAEELMLGTELALVVASLAALRGLARPLLRGPWARLYQLGGLGMGVLAPLMLQRVGGARSAAGVASSLLVLIGGALARFAIVEAGKQSADDPYAYFEYTRPER
jgi:formate-dependent nitrite reductase membrane component NrfD